MFCQLRVLAVALCAMLTLGGAAATEALATTSHLTTEADSTTLTAEAKTNLILTTATASMSCEKFTTDTTVGTDTAMEITAVNLAYEGDCTITEGSTTVPADIEMNGCDYLLTVTEAIEAGHKYGGSIHLKCPVGKQIETKVTVGGVKLNCLDIHEQTPTVPTVDYTNEGSGTTRNVKMQSTIEGITYEKTAACGTGEANNAKFTGEIVFTGENAGKEHVGVTLSESEKSRELTTESDSTTLTSEVKSEQILAYNISEFVRCEELKSSTSVGTATTQEVTITNLEYAGNCTVTEGSIAVPADIKMNGCDYLFEITEEKTAGEKYAGPMEIKCPEEKKIEVKLTVAGIEINCLDIGAQIPTSSGVDYTNQGTGTTMNVKLTSTVEGISYTKTGSCGSKEGNNLKYTGEVALNGKNAKEEHVGVTIS